MTGHVCDDGLGLWIASMRQVENAAFPAPVAHRSTPPCSIWSAPRTSISNNDMLPQTPANHRPFRSPLIAAGLQQTSATIACSPSHPMLPKLIELLCPLISDYNPHTASLTSVYACSGTNAPSSQREHSRM